MILSRELAQHHLGVGKAEWLTIAESQLGSADNAGSGLLAGDWQHKHRRRWKMGKRTQSDSVVLHS